MNYFDSMDKNNEAIIITAGIKRLGLAFARTILEMGLKVVLHYRSAIGEAEVLEKEYPSRVYFIQQELENCPEHLIEKASALNLNVKGLVNNAAIFSKGNLTDPLHFSECLQINTIAPLRLSAEFNRLIRNGWIINITDANITHPNLSYQNYRISKLFLEEITRQQAVLFAPNIRVNAIAPGAMLPSEGNESLFTTLSDKIPLRSVGNIQSLTNAFAFLIKNDYITGQILRVDGGWGLL